MIRFYGLTDRDCMQMPFTRFMLLYGKIDQLQIEEEVRDLIVAHSDPQQRMRTLEAQLGQHNRSPQPATTRIDGLSTVGVDSAAIDADRARQRAAAERLAAESPDAAFERIRAARAARDLPPDPVLPSP